ncbi:MAG: sulfurtransferase TusA family protein [Lentisphaeraceae bacterium]|nr:sulfurtransferase TusA family protein [Lentisphaeraceae bacterium]
MAKEVFAKGFYNDVYFNLREAVKHTLQAALIEAGESAKEFAEYWELYTKFFAANTKLPARPEVQVEKKDLDKASAEALLAVVSEYCETISSLYQADKENLKPVQSGEVETSLDLTGIACPMNYVKAKLALEKLADGDQLEMLLDTGAAFRTVPSSLQEDGHKIVELAPVNEDSAYKLIVVKNGAK